jgi:hypothetical protein
MRMISAFHFREPKGFRIPLGGSIEICDGQGKYVVLVWERRFEKSCVWHWKLLFAVEAGPSWRPGGHTRAGMTASGTFFVHHVTFPEPLSSWA